MLHVFQAEKMHILVLNYRLYSDGETWSELDINRYQGRGLLQAFDGLLDFVANLLGVEGLLTLGLPFIELGIDWNLQPTELFKV